MRAEAGAPAAHPDRRRRRADAAAHRRQARRHLEQPGREPGAARREGRTCSGAAATRSAATRRRCEISQQCLVVIAADEAAAREALAKANKIYGGHMGAGLEEHGIWGIARAGDRTHRAPPRARLHALRDRVLRPRHARAGAALRRAGAARVPLTRCGSAPPATRCAWRITGRPVQLLPVPEVVEDVVLAEARIEVLLERRLRPCGAASAPR